MSVLSKIRSRAGLLVAIIGIALFAFILGDIFTSGKSIFSSRENNVGVIAGEDVSYAEFQNKVAEELDNMKKNNPNQPPPDEAKTDNIVQSLWQQTVNEKVLNREYEKLGITVTTPELTDQMTGNDPNPLMSQYFSDQQTGRVRSDFSTPDGRLNMALVRKFVAQMNEPQALAIYARDAGPDHQVPVRLRQRRRCGDQGEEKDPHPFRIPARAPRARPADRS